MQRFKSKAFSFGLKKCHKILYLICQQTKHTSCFSRRQELADVQTLDVTTDSNISDSLSAPLSSLLLRLRQAVQSGLHHDCHGNGQGLRVFVSVHHSPPFPPQPTLNRTACFSCYRFVFLLFTCSPSELPGKTKLIFSLNGTPESVRANSKCIAVAPCGAPRQNQTLRQCFSTLDLFRGSTGSGIPAMESLGMRPTPSMRARFPEKAPAAFTTMAHSTGWYSKLFGICTCSTEQQQEKQEHKKKPSVQDTNKSTEGSESSRT